MCSIGKCVHEIKSSSAVVAARASIGSHPEKINTMRFALATSLNTMIRSINQQVTADSASEMLTAIHDTCFTSEEKELMCDSVNDKLLGSVVPTKLKSLDKQKFATDGACLNYFTENDWRILGDASTPFNHDSKVACIVKRLRSGGMTQAAPIVCKDLVAMLAAASWSTDVCTPTALHEHVLLLTKRFTTSSDTSSVDHLPVLHTWPTTPHELPGLVQEAMYGDEAPVAVRLDSFTTVRCMTSCRGNNKVVKSIYDQQAITPVTRGRPVRPAHITGVGTMPTMPIASPMTAMIGNSAIDLAAWIQQAESYGLGRDQAMELALVGAGLLNNHADRSTTPRARSVSPVIVQPASSPIASSDSHQSPSSVLPSVGGVHDAVASAHVGCVSSSVVGPTPQKHASPTPSSVDAALNEFEIPVGSDTGDGSEKRTMAEVRNEHQRLLSGAKAKASAAKYSAESSGTNHQKGCMKRPAAACAKALPHKKSNCKADDVIQPPMPAHGSVLYKKGKILASDSRKGWRVWPDRAVLSKEQTVKYGDDKQKSYRHALSLCK